ncbi:unnamed protein product [Rotaria sp. Silwood1]|nr:unnamed protein product [Rotaria sp. Silwood1]CAF1644106.1 unnamed protein product [Rotaria sp. Silwood1]CAF3795282.1 unnamed protein product [Rotaria sp. Silwood1]CAF3917191.1 unnamed protein product [Rotaria sp. Silwood1]
MPIENCPTSFRVMTYNIRWDVVEDGQNQWNLRKDRLISLIRYRKPDIFGVQEALPHQMVDLRMAFPAFGWYGVGRDDGKNAGEFSAIFYRSNRFEILDNGTFWLSETPGESWTGQYFRDTILIQHVIAFLKDEENVINVDDAIFVQDKAPFIRANMTQYLLQDNDINFWGNDTWPGKPPDLNVAEHIGIMI